MCVRHTIEETLLVTHTERIFAIQHIQTTRRRMSCSGKNHIDELGGWFWHQIWRHVLVMMRSGGGELLFSTTNVGQHKTVLIDLG